MIVKDLILNKEERNVIADFIHSHHSNLLIKSDLLKLIDVLYNHQIINHQKKIELAICINIGKGDAVISLKNILGLKIDNYVIQSIMNEYYGK